MLEDNLYNKAEKKVDEKISFYHHLFSYCAHFYWSATSTCDSQSKEKRTIIYEIGSEC